MPFLPPAKTEIPLLAIGIPTFNRSASLKRVLASICGQVGNDLATKIRIVIADDASNDDTEAVAKAYASRYSYVRFHQHEANQGLARNFLYLLEIMEAEYIWLFGDDDTLLPEALPEIVRLLNTRRWASLTFQALQEGKPFGPSFGGKSHEDELLTICQEHGSGTVLGFMSNTIFRRGDWPPPAPLENALPHVWANLCWNHDRLALIHPLGVVEVPPAATNHASHEHWNRRNIDESRQIYFLYASVAKTIIEARNRNGSLPKTLLPEFFFDGPSGGTYTEKAFRQFCTAATKGILPSRDAFDQLRNLARVSGHINCFADLIDKLESTVSGLRDSGLQAPRQITDVDTLSKQVFGLRESIAKIPSRKLRVAWLSLHSPKLAVSMLRVVGPLTQRPEIELLVGARITQEKKIEISSNTLNQADVILVHRGFASETNRQIMDYVYRCRRRVVFETDDYLPDVPDEYNKDHYKKNRTYFEEMIHFANVITCPTEALSHRLGELSNKVRVLPNLLLPRIWSEPAQRAKYRRRETKHPLRLIFTGTFGHKYDLAMLEDVLLEVLNRHRDIELHCIGTVSDRLAKAGIHAHSTNVDYQIYASYLATLAPDLAIVPLRHTPFNKMISDIKFVDFAAIGVPGIFSDVGIYNDVRHGENGWLVPNDPLAWKEQLLALLDDRDAIVAAGQAAQDEVWQKRVLNGVSSRPWLNTYEELLSG